jgi:hypothetical protein
MTKRIRNKTVNELPLNEIMPKVYGYAHWKKSMRWRNDQAATLFYAEALMKVIQKTK